MGLELAMNASSFYFSSKSSAPIYEIHYFLFQSPSPPITMSVLHHTFFLLCNKASTI
jgi:hypothetical protein